MIYRHFGVTYYYMLLRLISNNQFDLALWVFIWFKEAKSRHEGQQFLAAEFIVHIHCFVYFYFCCKPWWYSLFHFHTFYNFPFCLHHMMSSPAFRNSSLDNRGFASCVIVWVVVGTWHPLVLIANQNLCSFIAPLLVIYVRQALSMKSAICVIVTQNIILSNAKSIKRGTETILAS